MRISGKHRYGILCAGIAVAALGTAMAPAVSHAQSAYQSSASQPDADVVARVQRALQSDSTLDSRHIDVAVEHGDVVLKGFVQDNHALLAAQQVATKAAGTHKIVNQITIKQNPANAP